MTGTPRFLDIHILQSIPYSALNRDDLGSPKDCQYGGVNRARVSSQAWKRAARLHMTEPDPARRTARIIGAVSDRLTAQGWDAGLARTAGEETVLAAGLGIDSKNPDKTTILMFVTDSQLDDLAVLANVHHDAIAVVHAARPATADDTDPAGILDPDAKAAAKPAAKARKAPKKGSQGSIPPAEVKAVLNSVRGSVGLFGRMVAEIPGGTVDGAVQVAHSLSTHAISTEVDFFTAVDDLLPDEETGSAHMGTAEYVSGTFYRYATVDLDELARNLGGDTDAAAALAVAFARAFAESIPSGSKRNTAPNTLPALVHVAARDDRPLSYVTAFEAPVRASQTGGHLAPSIDSLAGHATALAELLSAEPAWHGWAGLTLGPIPGIGSRSTSYDDLWAAAAAAIAGRTAPVTA